MRLNLLLILFVCLFFTQFDAIENNMAGYRHELKLREKEFATNIVNYRMDGILLINGNISGSETIDVNNNDLRELEKVSNFILIYFPITFNRIFKIYMFIYV